MSHGRLEANLRDPDEPPRGAAVVCHPHPQHGGTMHTKAVFRTAQALNEVRVRALRFNFRGVGTSTGSWSGGEGEMDDVRAALEWMADESPSLPLVMAGFSFGSRVGLRVGVEDDRVRALVGLGLPVEMYDYGFLADTEKPTLLIQGAGDPFGGEEAIREVVEPLGSQVTLVTVPDSGHFFHDRFDQMKAAIRTFFTEGPGAPIFEEGAGAGAAGP